MKKWRVSDIRWASAGDLELPFWSKWNKQNPLPDGFWQRIWEYPYVASKIPGSDKSLDVGGTYPFILFKNFPEAISVDCRNLNKLNHPLHHGKWPKEKLIICDAAQIPLKNSSINYVFSISSIEEMPHTIEVLKEMIRVANYRVTVTMDVSNDLGIPLSKIRDLEQFLNTRIPLLPDDVLTSVSSVLSKFKQNKRKEYQHIRVLAFTIDSLDTPKSTAILIPHWNSWPFLNLCLKHINKNSNNYLKEKIYVLDDASDDGSFEIAKKTYENNNVTFIRYDRPDKQFSANIGALLDAGLKLIKEQYVAMIDADAFPLTSDWLSFPIWLIEKYNCSSVGLDTGLSSSYLDKTKGVWWQPNKGYFQRAGLYDNNWFTCTNNLYRVMPTAMAKIVSESIGFSRFNSGNKIQRNIPGRIGKKIRDYGERLNLLHDRRYPYLPEGCDNGVAANHFIDINRMGPKFNIPLTSYIGLTPKDGTFGQNISGLIFHFALSTRALSKQRREVHNAGKTYAYWVNLLNRIEDKEDSYLQKMIKASLIFKKHWNNPAITAMSYKKEFQYINDLIRKYKKEGL